MELQTNIKTGDLKISAPEGVTTEVRPNQDLVTNQETKQPEKKEEKPQEDLITRASKVKLEEPKSKEGIFDVGEIENIKDPQAKEYAQKAYKSLLADYTRKRQEESERLRVAETKLAEATRWTPERLKQEQQNPDFIKAAQQVIGEQEKEDSNLSEADRKLLEEAKRESIFTRQQNAQLLKQQQDEKLKTKYHNYAPDIIDLTTTKLINGEVQATREDLWKVIDYENMAQRTYKLGYEDGLMSRAEKIQSSSIEGISANADMKIQPEKNESDRDFLRRLYIHNKKQK